MIPRLFCAVWLAVAVTLQAQDKITLDWYCCYVGESLDDEVYGFDPDDQAKATVDKILENGGLLYKGARPVFELRAATISNAAATLIKGRKAIIYSQEFLARIQDVTKNDWAALSVLAHEVGHHLYNHNLSEKLSQAERRELELQADHYAGFILERMGSESKDAQAGIRAFASKEETSKYPSKAARLAATLNGWKQAHDLRTSVTKPTPRRKLPPEVLVGMLWDMYTKIGTIPSQPSLDIIERRIPTALRAPDPEDTKKNIQYLSDNWPTLHKLALLPIVREWNQIGSERAAGELKRFDFEADFANAPVFDFQHRRISLPKVRVKVYLDADGALRSHNFTVEDQ